MLYKLLELIIRRGTKLGAKGFYPLPLWARTMLLRMNPSKARLYCARLQEGVDLSDLAPNELGCANAVTQIDRMLFGDTIEVSTWKLLEHYVLSPEWMEWQNPTNGCTVIAATGTGNGRIKNGHVGIYDNGLVWNNNSYTGKWAQSYTIDSFKAYYQGEGGMRVRYFIRIRK